MKENKRTTNIKKLKCVNPQLDHKISIPVPFTFLYPNFVKAINFKRLTQKCLPLGTVDTFPISALLRSKKNSGTKEFYYKRGKRIYAKGNSIKRRGILRSRRATVKVSSTELTQHKLVTPPTPSYKWLPYLYPIRKSYPSLNPVEVIFKAVRTMKSPLTEIKGKGNKARSQTRVTFAHSRYRDSKYLRMPTISSTIKARVNPTSSSAYLKIKAKQKNLIRKRIK
jgi:hypothetical protein